MACSAAAEIHGATLGQCGFYASCQNDPFASVLVSHRVGVLICCRRSQEPLLQSLHTALRRSGGKRLSRLSVAATPQSAELARQRWPSTSHVD